MNVQSGKQRFKPRNKVTFARIMYLPSYNWIG
jgi:hypothetical protein